MTGLHRLYRWKQQVCFSFLESGLTKYQMLFVIALLCSSISLWRNITVFTMWWPCWKTSCWIPLLTRDLYTAFISTLCAKSSNLKKWVPRLLGCPIHSSNLVHVFPNKFSPYLLVFNDQAIGGIFWHLF